ncbi:sulfate adenylyltransferase subunit 1 [Kitasatospora sp. NPDC057940]|uniref:sulfate adenylyltransferase subunit 1 n=1 Tax=Kitasatospora sp. NPDC057940 TaxID=3346285 RepID=UPI0036D7A505
MHSPSHPLRLATAGSVDDGKSTLIGRLLHDTGSVPADELAAIERASLRRGLPEPDLALLTDGLRAEREQGITIDVAYRYFTTRRRFVLADTPGHVQYTRNMVTGASTAEVVVILVDARKALAEQARRHAAISALLRVPRILLAVNKMDLVDWSESRFAAVVAEFTDHAASLGVCGTAAIPLSALTGDNVVTPSARMDWYRGPTLLSCLETVQTGPEPGHGPARLPVQYVIRTGTAADRRHAYAGQLLSGTLRVGDAVTVLPAGHRTSISAIDLLGTPVDTATAPQSVAISLADQLHVSRGDLIAPTAAALPTPTRNIRATVCQLHDRPLRTGDRILVKHTTRTVRATVGPISARRDALSGAVHGESGRLAVNDIGTVLLRTAEALAPDPYAESRRTGALLLIDPTDGATLAAGLVE